MPINKISKDNIHEIIEYAHQGDAQAQSILGNCYYNGNCGLKQNYAEAIKWFKLAENNRMLGQCYFYGHGVEQSYEEAIKFFVAADDKDMLGECYLHGLGVARNVEKTIELWESACEERCRYYDLMYKLGHLYGDGIEMDPDYEKAYTWWSKLAENDSGDFACDGSFAEALYMLACYHYEGKGVMKNLTLALKYFKCTIDLFYGKEIYPFYRTKRNDETAFTEYDRLNHKMAWRSYKIDWDRFISQEPDFIIHARKILIMHGKKSIINDTKKVAENGDEKAAMILNEFGIEYVNPKQPESAPMEVQDASAVKEETKHDSPVQLSVGDMVLHSTFGNGTVCESYCGYVCIDFASVEKKKFLDPQAFEDGFLSKI